MLTMDAIHYKVMDDKNRPVTSAIYNVLGFDLPGMYISRSEGQFLAFSPDRFTNTGVRENLIASVDNLTGFSDAINSVFLETIVQS